MSEPSRPGTLVLIAFSPRPRVRMLNYLAEMAIQDTSIDFVVWDAHRWQTTDMQPPVPSGVRIHEIRPSERSLPTQRVKALFVYHAPGWTLSALRRIAESSRVTRPAVPVVEFAQKVHRRIAQILERRIFASYNHVGRPHRLARAAERALAGGAIDFAGVSRIVAGEPYAVTYAWHLSQRFPDIPTTVHLDRSPVPPVRA